MRKILTDKWMDLEVKYTRNDVPDQFIQYFEKYRADLLKFKTTQYP